METISLAGAEFFYKGNSPHLKVGKKKYELPTDPFNTMLNLLRIPTKYLHRFAEEDAEMASGNVNFWLDKKRDGLVLAVKDGEVVHVSEADRTFVSAEIVTSALEKYLGCKNSFITTEGELVVGLFRTNIPPIELVSGQTAFLSVRLTYSECFTITPRIDAVLTVEGSFDNYYYSIQGRKFRLSNMGQTHIVNEVIEFVDIVLEQVQKQFVPALDKMIEYDAKLNIYGFVNRLCSELRLPTRICRPLLEGIEETEVSLPILVRSIANNLLPEVRSEMIDYVMAREIEIALSKAIMYGRFK